MTFLNSHMGWFLQICFVSVILTCRAQDVCIVEDFQTGSNGIFSQGCAGTAPFSVKSYADSEHTPPNASNGIYFLATPDNSTSSCITSARRMDVASGSRVQMTYHTIGTSGNCLALVLPTSNIGLIPMENSNEWKTLSIIVTSTTSISIQIQCGSMFNSQLAIDNIIITNSDDCPRKDQSTTTTELSTIPSTSTDEPTTSESTTPEASTEETSTEITSTSEFTSTEPTATDPTTPDTSTEEATTPDISTEEPTMPDTTTEEPATPDTSTEEATTPDASTEETSTEITTTSESTSSDPTTMEPTTSVPSTEEPTTTDSSTEISTPDISNETTSTEESTTPDASTEETSTETTTSTDSTTSEEQTTTDSSTDFSTPDTSNETTSTEEPSSPDTSTEETSTPDSSTETTTTNDLTSTEPTTPDITTESTNTDSTSTVETTTEIATSPDTEPTSTEEPSTTDSTTEMPSETTTDNPTTPETTTELTTTDTPTLPPNTVCLEEDFEKEMGIFSACPGWIPFMTGSYDDFFIPSPEESNGLFLASRPSIVGTCATTERNIYVDINSQVIFDYYVYGVATNCFIRLDDGNQLLAIDLIPMDNSRVWETKTLSPSISTTASISIQCGGSTSALLIIDNVRVESTSGSCEEPSIKTKFLKFLLAK